MANTTSIPTGLNIPSQIPLDTVRYVLNESALSNLGTNDYLAFIYFKNLIIHCFEENSNWIWREVQVGEENTGLLSVDYEYPFEHEANNINYSNKKYNFFQYIFEYDIENIGTGVGIYDSSSIINNKKVFSFKSLKSSNSTVDITIDGDEIDLKFPGGGTTDNFANADLTLTQNRIHNLDSKTLHFNNGKQIKSTVNVVQPTGEASFEETGYGSTFTDIIKIIKNGLGNKIIEIFGNKSVKFYGNVWSNGPSTSITSNTSYGEDALLTNVSGLRNSAFGLNALRNCTSNDNSAFGMNSLYSLTTGIQNVGVGFESLSSITSGVQNTGIGYGVMNTSNSSSSFNTVIGFASLTRTEDEIFINSANHCTYIGNDVKTKSGNLNPVNEIVIGSIAKGRGNNTIQLGNIDSQYIHIPEHTTTEINAFTGMVKGAMVFNTTLNTLCFYNGSSWQKVTTTAM